MTLQEQDMTMTPGPDESIKCTTSGCSCLCFKPGSVQTRSCELCSHGWVAHAMEKLRFQTQHPSSCRPVEVALPGPVFDLSSLVLYGTQAIPVQLKILLDRLYSVLTSEQVSHILNTLGWSLGDYIRGYMLQFPRGQVLDCWVTVTPEEEPLILKQFLRFGETRPIVQLMTPRALEAASHLSRADRDAAPKSFQSNIGTLTDQKEGSQGSSCLAARVCCFKEYNTADQDDTVRHVGNVPDGQPLHFPSSDFQSLAPPTEDLVHPRTLTRCQQKSKVVERRRQEGGRREQKKDPILEQSNLSLEIKADPDKSDPAPSMWPQGPRFDDDKEADLHLGLTSQENASSLPSFLNSTLITASSPLSPPETSQKLHSPSSSSLPSFSSSFICPLPSSPFSPSLHLRPSPSSSLHPLPSSLCALPSRSPAGGRKGRVSCGICGKSFYDKGTLKIHYNAVHLKIKHRCTVAGCTMVFSSLRSRNRHSANPNPRLHTITSRDAHTHGHPDAGLQPDAQMHKDKHARRNIHTRAGREKEISTTPQKYNDDKQTLGHVHTPTSRSDCQELALPQTDSSPPPSSEGTNQSFTWSDSRSVLHNQALPPSLIPVYASSLGSLPSLVPLVDPANEKTKHCQSLLSLHPKQAAPDSLHCTRCIPVSSCNAQPVNCDHVVTDDRMGKASTSSPTTQRWQWEFYEPIPKKKPRKSSMPVKIEREKVVEKGNKEREAY